MLDYAAPAGRQSYEAAKRRKYNVYAGSREAFHIPAVPYLLLATPVFCH